ncbi:MAG: helix-turn-helix domain-containing protein [Nibricoccus sp.]
MSQNSSKLPQPPPGFERSDCPVSCALEILGDKWTLLVIRDLVMGKKRYGDFQASPESIPTNILAERLKRLEASGLVEKTPYQENPVRYEYSLTPAGAELRGILISVAEWANRHIPGTRRDWRKK